MNDVLHERRKRKLYQSGRRVLLSVRRMREDGRNRPCGDDPAGSGHGYLQHGDLLRGLHKEADAGHPVKREKRPPAATEKALTQNNNDILP